MTTLNTEIDWASAGLGQKSDRKIAKTLGVSHDLVRKRRQQLGIEPFYKPKYIDWDAQPLGRVTDEEIAQSLGVGRASVCTARKKRGISPLHPEKSTKGVDWDLVPLGAKPDAELARDLGVATTVVLNARKRRKISRHGLPSRDVDWSKVPLGQDTDEAVASVLGTTAQTVCRHRNALGILPFKDTYLTLENEGGNYPEALIDLFWHEQSIPHQFQVRIGKYIADWVIHGDTVVEYAGFAAGNYWGEAYEQKLGAKIAFYKKEGWKILILRPSDLPQYRPKGTPSRTSDWVSPSGINWTQQPWGQISDTNLAKNLGTSQGEVSAARRKLGIPSYWVSLRTQLQTRVGKVPDHFLAEGLRISREFVRKTRVGFGIEPFRESP